MKSIPLTSRFQRISRISASLAQSQLAETVPLRELQVLERLGTAIPFAAGREAMAEDGFGRECMVVLDGSFTVERGGEWIADLEPGDFMGEVALLTRQPRNATVTAAEDSMVYAFSRREFSSLLRECPVLSTRVHHTAEERTVAA